MPTLKEEAATMLVNSRPHSRLENFLIQVKLLVQAGEDLAEVLELTDGTKRQMELEVLSDKFNSILSRQIPF